MAVNDDARKAAARERARKYRERKAAERDAARSSARDARDAVAPTTMRDAVASSLTAAKWIVASDAAAVAQAHALAKQIDLLDHAGDTTRLLSAHGRLTTVLDRLGATPVVRQQHELRSRKLTPEVPDAGSEGSTAKPEGNVSQFRRPPKRGA